MDPAMTPITKDRTQHAQSGDLNGKVSSQAASASKVGRVAQAKIKESNKEDAYFEQPLGTASRAEQRKMERITNPKTYRDYLDFLQLLPDAELEKRDIDPSRFQRRII
jgi:hypothetical protein